MILMSAANEPQVVEEFLKATVGVEKMTLAEMPYGDYSWGDVDGHQIGVERKEIRDLLTSAMNGRLEQQLAGCLEEYDKVVLLIEGRFYPTNGGDAIGVNGNSFLSPPQKKPFKAMGGLLLSLQSNGVDVVYSGDVTHTGFILQGMYEYTQKADHKMLRRYIRTKPTIHHVDPKVDVLLAIAKVLQVRLSVIAATRIIEKYGAITVALDQVDDWQYVQGVGPRIVEGMKVGLS